jgi:outer membrane protein TolC
MSDIPTFRLRSFACSLFLVLVSAVGPARAESPALPAALPEDVLPGLKVLLQTAVKQSPSLLKANIEIAQAEASVYGAASAEWPSVGGYFRYGRDETAVASNTNARTSTTGPVYSVYLNQPVYYWGTLQAATEVSKLGVKIAERQYGEAYRGLVLTIRGQYLGLISKKMSLRNQRFYQQVTETAAAIQESKLKEGSITQGDIIGIRMQLEEAQIGTEKAVAEYEQAKRVLARLSGVSELKEEDIPAELPKTTYAPATASSFFEEMSKQGLANTFTAQIYRDSVRQAELNYKIAARRLYPKFGLGLSFGQSNQATASSGSVSQTAITTTTVGVTASWTIFDGFATKGAKLAALASKREAERGLRAYTDGTLEQIQLTEKQIGFAARTVDVADRRAKLADDTLVRVKEDAKLGVVSQGKVDTSAQLAYSLELTALNARAEFLNKWAEYLSLLGVDPALNNLSPRYLSNGKQ